MGKTGRLESLAAYKSKIGFLNRSMVSDLIGAAIDLVHVSGLCSGGRDIAIRKDLGSNPMQGRTDTDTDEWGMVSRGQ